MPNKIWEKATVLPTGGQQQSFIRPNGVADEDLKLQNPMTPTLGNMSNVCGVPNAYGLSMLLLRRVSVTLAEVMMLCS